MSSNGSNEKYDFFFKVVLVGGKIEVYPGSGALQ
jgi:hypothetical protein